MERLELTVEQQEVLDEVGVNLEGEAHYVAGNKLHAYSISANAWFDGEYLVFVDENLRDQKSFICYLGAEDDAELVCHFRGLSIYEGVSENQIERFSEKGLVVGSEYMTFHVDYSDGVRNSPYTPVRKG